MYTVNTDEHAHKNQKRNTEKNRAQDRVELINRIDRVEQKEKNRQRETDREEQKEKNRQRETDREEQKENNRQSRTDREEQNENNR